MLQTLPRVFYGGRCIVAKHGGILNNGLMVVGFRWTRLRPILGIKRYTLRDTICKWVDRKDMPAHKVSRLWRFRKDEVDRLGIERKMLVGEHGTNRNPAQNYEAQESTINPAAAFLATVPAWGNKRI